MDLNFTSFRDPDWDRMNYEFGCEKGRYIILDGDRNDLLKQVLDLVHKRFDNKCFNN